MNRREQLVIVRGGGDLATGTIHALHTCGYPVIVLETRHPSAIRRHVAFSEAVYDGSSTIEGVICRRALELSEAYTILKSGQVALLTDPEGTCIAQAKPWAVIDAILAKRNLGTNRNMAEKTIALGPGFTAGKDVDLVIETKRGHNLGRIITEGQAAPNTGIPGIIAGYGKERVIHAPAEGILKNSAQIGDRVKKDQVIAVIENEMKNTEVKASLTGILRGMIRDGYPVTKGFKIADIDPRESEYENCFTISDKARCIAGSVLTGLLMLEMRDGR